MADSLPSPPSTRESSPSYSRENATKDELIHHLDNLLEQYLQVLDDYTTLREELSKNLSNGFLSLAHAQRTSNLGPGRRYGQDGFDGRMKALKRINFISKSRTESSSGGLTASSTETPNEDGIKSGDRFAASISIHNSNKLNPPEGHDDTTSQKTGDELEMPSLDKSKETAEGTDSTNEGQAPKKPKIDPAYRDPVTWYGILVPPNLRQAQKHFSASVESTVPNLFSAISALQSLEEQIWSLRSELGMKSQYTDENISQVPIRPVATSASAATT